MIFNCKLYACCLDCEDAHIDVRNETAWPSGQITPTTVKSTLYCRHMHVCAHLNDITDGDRIIMVPLSNFMDDVSGCDATTEDEYEGDGINE